MCAGSDLLQHVAAVGEQYRREANQARAELRQLKAAVRRACEARDWAQLDALLPVRVKS